MSLNLNHTFFQLFESTVHHNHRAKCAGVDGVSENFIGKSVALSHCTVAAVPGCELSVRSVGCRASRERNEQTRTRARKSRVINRKLHGR